MPHLIGLSGSLRKDSFNTRLLRAAALQLPAGTSMDVRTLHGIPLYNADVEAADGPPEAVTALKASIVEADGLLIATPEYNNSMPGVLKNAIDWVSRPASDIGRVFGGKPVAIIGAATGGFGTTLAQAAWLPVLRSLGVNLYSGHRLLVSRARDVFAEDGTIADDKIRDRLSQLLEGFARFAS